MYFVYNFLLTLGFLILFPWFFLQALRHGKYIPGLLERLRGPAKPEGKGQPAIWLHCVSVGETQAALPLVKRLREVFPDHLLVVSTVTVAGQTLARDLFKQYANAFFYLPFDWPWSVRRALNAISPTALLLMERELWPGLLRACHSRDIPVILVNGRLSEQSFRRYAIVKRFMRQVLDCIDVAVMQTGADVDRICGLGLERKRAFVCGSLKFDAVRIPANKAVAELLGERFNTGTASLILAASTHAPEERLILEAFQLIRSDTDKWIRLMIAPRHPERFSEVAELIARSGLSWARRTETARPNDQDCEIILLDTIGELNAIYPLATVVFVGGSIAKVGGHNILEPAATGSCIITGPFTHNFEEIVRVFAQLQAIVQISAAPEDEMLNSLCRSLAQLLSDPSLRAKLGERAANLVEENLGATERTMELISPVVRNKEHQERSFTLMTAPGR